MTYPVGQDDESVSLLLIFGHAISSLLTSVSILLLGLLIMSPGPVSSVVFLGALTGSEAVDQQQVCRMACLALRVLLDPSYHPVSGGGLSPVIDLNVKRPLFDRVQFRSAWLLCR